MAKKVFVNNSDVEKWNKWLEVDEIDWDDPGVDFDYDKTVFCKTVTFEDGTQADLKVCSGQTNLWCEVVWFDKHGNEIACSDCGDTLDGLWECPLLDHHQYDIEVVREKSTGKTTWRVEYWEHQSTTIDVEADTEEKAIEKAKSMVECGEVDFSTMELGDCGYESMGTVEDEE